MLYVRVIITLVRHIGAVNLHRIIYLHSFIEREREGLKEVKCTNKDFGMVYERNVEMKCKT